MTSKIKVDNINKVSDDSNIIKKCGSTTTVGSGSGNTVVVCGSTVTIGRCGGTVALASGATQSGFGRSGSVNWQTGSIKTATFTATNGEGYFANTSGGAFTMNLPAGSAGAIVAVADYTRTFNSNNLTISPNGSEKIGGVNADATLNVNGQSATFVYVDGTEGWINVQETETSQTGIPPAYITATGGTITTVCTNFKVHTFTGPGTFTITAGSGSLSKLDYYLVGGGGGGGGGEPGYWTGGGGGAGGFRESKTSSVSGCWSASPLVAACGSLGPFSAPTAIPVTVGAGGTNGTSNNPACSATAGGQGGNSIFSTITATGGGGGGKSTGCTGTPGSAPARFGQPGGSGGGSGGGGTNPIGNGNTPPVSPPQGNNGGQGSVPSAGRGGGGGGAAAVGGTYPSMSGGSGIASSITGSPVGRAGGGKGDGSGNAGPANSGDGGDSNPCGGNAAAGGSGVVIVRYRFQ